MYTNYTYYGIPVGAINIDSAWSTGFNNFIWNTEKFPNAS
jgi:alpha-glucosidase (family GH31 glycosyl hydrolase)